MNKKSLKKLLGTAVALMLTATAVAAHASEPIKIIVDERELVFEDQAPVIAEETNRTLIPLRFVCASAGASVNWDGDTQTVTVTSGDNRNQAVVKIGSDEMIVYYYPSVFELKSEVQKLDQAPVIMNDRTMIPVRAVLEAIGAKVDWDGSSKVINITSRAYMRYLRDMGVEGFEVNYPLSDGNTQFDKAPENIENKEYSAKEDLPALSLSCDTENAKKDDIVDIYVNLSNIEKFSDKELYLSTLTLGLIYDHSKLEYNGYKYIDKDGEFDGTLGAANDNYTDDSLKIASVAALRNSVRNNLSNGKIAKVSFKVLTDEKTEVSISARINSRLGKDTAIDVAFEDDTTVNLSEANELYIDTTPIVING